MRYVRRVRRSSTRTASLRCRSWRAALLLGALSCTACAPSVVDLVRREAHARRRLWDDGVTLRLECDADAIAVERITRDPDPVTGEPRASTLLARHLSRAGLALIASMDPTHEPALLRAAIRQALAAAERSTS